MRVRHRVRGWLGGTFNPGVQGSNPCWPTISTPLSHKTSQERGQPPVGRGGGWSPRLPTPSGAGPCAPGHLGRQADHADRGVARQRRTLVDDGVCAAGVADVLFVCVTPIPPQNQTRWRPTDFMWLRGDGPDEVLGFECLDFTRHVHDEGWLASFSDEPVLCDRGGRPYLPRKCLAMAWREVRRHASGRCMNLC